ncbi:MAG: DUF4139 domain-containing protein [Pseudomonadota bacterium]
MKRKSIFLAILAILFWCDFAMAKVDLVILPERENVQLTIYNSADLTLVRERRPLTLKKGLNNLQFSWANTLIDPTSLEMLPKMEADKIDILDLTFPRGVRDLGVWQVQSQISGSVPVEITFLTSGLSWRAFYMGTLTADETAMTLNGYVRVTNASGEDYENAQTRLIVGKINLIDRIADLARREAPYGRPGPALPPPMTDADVRAPMMMEAKAQFARAERMALPRPKEIIKEALSEYFLYTIEGRETIPNGWSKRLPSFQIHEIPVVNLYKYEEERFGNQVVRFLSFKNDKEHHLGVTPIPGGTIKLYRRVDLGGHLSYEGSSNFKYIPLDEDVELNLGAVENVIVLPKLMKFKTDRYLFDNKGNISGWDEIREYEVVVKNTRDIPARAEIMRNFTTPSWEIQNDGDFGNYEKVDLDTVKYTLQLNAHATRKFRYTHTTHHGQRAH